MYLIARSLTVILVPIFSVFEVGVRLKLEFLGPGPNRLWLPGASRGTYTRFFAFSALRKADT